MRYLTESIKFMKSINFEQDDRSKEEATILEILFWVIIWSYPLAFINSILNIHVW